MTKRSRRKAPTVAALVGLLLLAGKADAATCGSSAAGFEAWKAQFAAEARAKGVSAATVAALLSTNYATATIAADRGQRPEPQDRSVCRPCLCCPSHVVSPSISLFRLDARRFHKRWPAFRLLATCERTHKNACQQQRANGDHFREHG